MELNKYKTINGPSTGDFRDRGSKFLAYAWPVNDVIDIKEQLQALKKEHPKAVHHCYAWRLGTDGTQFRANDDGEPAGSAGKPIMGQIDSFGLTNILVVVVRYFGGTLLGIPGLINAYKTATLMALEQAGEVERWVEQKVKLTFDYPVMGEVLYILKQHEANITQQDQGLFCTYEVSIPIPNMDKVLKKLGEVRSVKVE